MTYELLIALLGFAFVTSVTPGPNNLMLMASGVNFGFARTLPHMVGISLGHSFMVFVVGMGLAGIMQSSLIVMWAMKGLALAYMLWLAWKIAHSAAPGEGTARAQPFSFVQAAAFQWVNPKAWAMAVSANATYAPSGDFVGVAWVAGAFLCVNFPSIAVWALGGEAMRGLLSNPRNLQVFNWTMAVLLVLSILPVLWV